MQSSYYYTKMKSGVLFTRDLSVHRQNNMEGDTTQKNFIRVYFFYL